MQNALYNSLFYSQALNISDTRNNTYSIDSISSGGYNLQDNSGYEVFSVAINGQSFDFIIPLQAELIFNYGGNDAQWIKATLNFQVSVSNAFSSSTQTIN